MGERKYDIISNYNLNLTPSLDHGSPGPATQCGDNLNDVGKVVTVGIQRISAGELPIQLCHRGPSLSLLKLFKTRV